MPAPRGHARAPSRASAACCLVARRDAAPRLAALHLLHFFRTFCIRAKKPLPRRSPKAPRSSDRARSPLVKRHDAPPRPAACGRLDFERAPPAADAASDAAAADLYVSTFVKGIIDLSINNLAAGAVAAA